MRALICPMAEQIECFLAHKRRLGFTYRNEEWLLGEFDRVAATVDLPGEVLDETLVRRFVTDGTRDSRQHRLTLVRQLARFLAVTDPRTFVPHKRFLGVRRQRPVVRVLSRKEAGRLLNAFDQLTDSSRYLHRGIIHGMLLRVLLLTGLRRGEAIALTVADVDLGEAILSVRQGKFGKSRFVPVAGDLAERLRRYMDLVRPSITDRRSDAPFFPGPNGSCPCTTTSLRDSFHRALEAAGISYGGRGNGPRLHDLRHTFAVLRLLAWYEQGDDLSAKLPMLATYLGHIGLSSTQVYLHMTRDLVGEVTSRFEDRFGNIITADVAT